MKRMNCFAMLFLAFLGCGSEERPISVPEKGAQVSDSLHPKMPRSPESGFHDPHRLRTVTLLATNDIHGGIEPTIKQGVPTGGMAILGATVAAIRRGIEQRLGDRGGVVLVDAGDQFQGTLLSNYNEGRLVFSLMNELGYDAVVPGNHDYDFGPWGWLVDQAIPGSAREEDRNPRGVIEGLATQAKFPLLSANTYLKKSLFDLAGAPVTVAGVGCVPEPKSTLIDWGRAERPAFLEPAVIRTVAGVRVALIGLDHFATPLVTSIENVSDLCFRDEAESYLAIRHELEGKADVFVLLVHDGNTEQEKSASEMVKKIVAAPEFRPAGAARSTALHAVVAGHTHFVHRVEVEGVPVIQSGAGGKMFGRIDIEVDFERGFSQGVDATVIRSYAGLPLREDECPKEAQDFCVQLGTPVSAPGALGSRVAYEGVELYSDPQLNSRILSRIQEARESVAPLASKRLGVAQGVITRNRIDESPMADFLTDSLRSLSGAEVALLNTGGLREDLPAGEISYETLFRVLPFGNHAVLTGPVPVEKLLAVLTRSVRTCGSYGALMQSGLKVVFERDCTRAGSTGIDAQARLLRVETNGGETVYDANAGISASPARVFQIATLDFLASGGAGYSELTGLPVVQDFGIFREALSQKFGTEPFDVRPSMDTRWKAVQPVRSSP